MTESQIDQAVSSEETMRQRIIHDLAQSPNETLEAVTDMLKTAPKSRWSVAVQVIRAIGSPHNKSAIPELIAQIGDLNSPAWNEVTQTLMDMGSQVIVPYLIEALLDKRKNRNYWLDEVAGICSLLTITPREYAVQCGPAITYLLGQETVLADLDPWYLLTVLEKIGPDCETYALPTLIDLVRREGTSEPGKQARALIGTFRRMSNPRKKGERIWYRQIIPYMRRSISRKSLTVHDSNQIEPYQRLLASLQ